MTTIRDLASEFDMQPFELRAFADDLLTAIESDADEISADTEAIIREALASAPAQEPTTAQVDDREDAVLQEVYEIVESAGYVETSASVAMYGEDEYDQDEDN